MNASVSSTATTLCSGAGCMNSATQSCPSCTVHPGIFLYCSQDCFKKNWPQHKLLHGRQKLAEGKQRDSQGNIPLDYLEIAYRPWSFQFSGSLRPYPVTPQMIISKASHPLIKRPDYADDGIPRSEEQNSGTIKVNSPEEIKKMRKVCRLARQVLDTVASHIKPGITTDALDKIVFQKAIELNCYPSPLNYRNFPKSVCTSVNEVVCHGIPDLRPLKDGDILNIDVTLYHDGHHGDLNETYVVGESVDEKGLLLIQTTREALYEAIKIVKPGTPYKEIGNVIQKVAASRGFTVNKSYCGHGVNTLFHGPPIVPHYANNKTKGIMQVGHTFTIEPMLCEGTPTDIHWPDDWTSVTKDGKRSAQFEHTLLVTESGCDILTERAK